MLLLSGQIASCSILKELLCLYHLLCLHFGGCLGKWVEFELEDLVVDRIALGVPHIGAAHQQFLQQ